MSRCCGCFGFGFILDTAVYIQPCAQHTAYYVVVRSVGSVTGSASLFYTVYLVLSRHCTLTLSCSLTRVPNRSGRQKKAERHDVIRRRTNSFTNSAPPPQGLWGASPGESRFQTTRATSGHAALVACPKSMSMLMSFFDRFWARLGALLGGLWGLWMALSRPKLLPRPSSNRILFE